MRTISWLAAPFWAQFQYQWLHLVLICRQRQGFWSILKCPLFCSFLNGMCEFVQMHILGQQRFLFTQWQRHGPFPTHILCNSNTTAYQWLAPHCIPRVRKIRWAACRTKHKELHKKSPPKPGNRSNQWGAAVGSWEWQRNSSSSLCP